MPADDSFFEDPIEDQDDDLTLDASLFEDHDEDGDFDFDTGNEKVVGWLKYVICLELKWYLIVNTLFFIILEILI